MALKLSIGFQKKIGLPDYGSAGANCQVEFEIDAGTLLTNLDGFHEKARHAFTACQQAVNDQLSRHTGQSSNGHGSNANQPANGNGHKNGNGANGNGNGNGHRTGNGAATPRPATQSQARAIRAIASKQRLELQKLLEQRFGVGRPEGLSLSDASALIDELKNGGEGGNA